MGGEKTLPELWLKLLDEGDGWSAEKIKRFVDAARDLRDLEAMSNDDFATQPSSNPGEAETDAS